MPFTPFHFGPGLLFKALAPRQFSLTTFVFTQVAIDFESLYFLMQPQGEVHRAAHSLWGSTLVGLAVAMVTPWFIRTAARYLPTLRKIDVDIARVPTLVGGIIGGLSHSLLDSVMHGDVRLLWPSHALPGLTGLLEIQQIHMLCYTCAAAAIVLFAARKIANTANR